MPEGMFRRPTKAGVGPPLTESIMDGTTRVLRERTGLDVIGCYGFGLDAAQADHLLASVFAGTKRATAGARFEYIEQGEALPEPGQMWGLLDGAGEPRFVVETTDVGSQRLGEVSPAFAWDEGELDRSLETWQVGHRAFLRGLGIQEPDRTEMVLERFRVVWPEPDEDPWLTDGVRMRRFDEADWVREVHNDRHGTTDVVGHGERWDVGDLPALVCEHDGRRVGLLALRPRSGPEVALFHLDVLAPDTGDVEAALRRGLGELVRLYGWRQVRPLDGTPAPRGAAGTSPETCWSEP